MGVLFAGGSLILQLVFWGIMATVWYVESFWMALGVALPFLLVYKVISWQMDREAALDEYLKTGKVPGQQNPALNPIRHD